VSVIVGFTVLLMLILLCYMSYRLFLRRKPIILLSLCLQIFSVTLALISFLNDVNIIRTNFIEACYILFGIVLPASFLTYDWIKMVRKVKEQGVFQGFIEAVQRESNAPDTNKDKKHLRPIIGERQITELIRDLNLNKDDIQKNIKKSLTQANVFISNKDYDNALEIYDTLLKLIRNCPSLYFNHGNICYWKGNYGDAVQSYRKVLEVNEFIISDMETPKDIFAVVKGRDKSENNKTAAEIKYEEFMVYYNLGNSLFKLHRYENAIDAYGRSLEINPNLEDASENIARALMAFGRKEEALEYYKKIVDNDTGNYKAHLAIASLYIEMKRHQDAVNELEECIRLNPSEAEGYEALGRVFAEMQKFKQAVEIYKKLVKLVPGEYKSLYNLGTSLYHSGEKEEAVECFKKVVSINPKSFNAYYNMAIAQDELGSQEEAISSFKKVLELKEDFIEAYNNLGIILSTQGRHLEALDIYIKGLKKNPEEYSLYYNMGITLSEMGRYYEAAEAYKNALEIKPDEYEIHYHLGAALMEMKKYSQAIEVYKSALKFKPDDYELFYSMSIVYSLLNKHDIAIDNLKKAFELNESLREDARTNRAFNSIKNMNEFKELVS